MIKKYKTFSFQLSAFNQKKGFSLVELVVVIGLVSILSLVVMTMLTRGFSAYRIKKQSVELEEKAAAVMREFEQTTRAATEIETATDNTIAFYRFYDLTSPSPDRVRYFMENTTFKVGITHPYGVEPDITYPAENETIEMIIENVTNPELIFTFYDSAGAEIETITDISSVKMIGLTISLDKDPNNPPNPITETTKVMLRNMKNNL